MSYQSLQDDTVRIEYTSGQPRGIVGGQSGNRPHRIDIDRKAEAGNAQYTPGTISSHFILHKNAGNNGYSETAIDADTQGGRHRLSDPLVAELRQAITKLEDLLICPVDVEFAIDHQDRLFLLQVRPVTRLPGGMDFAMPIPEEILTSGEGISEGYGSGPLWLANKRLAHTMPEGAIVVAQHAQEWMLERDFLKRVGGFVVAAGGWNDHVAIFLRQERVPLLVAGGQYPTVVAQIGQQVTLACARFDGSPAAFIATGDLTGKLVSHRSLSATLPDVPLAKAVPDDLSLPEGTLRQVASAFHWLTDQNARLLALFAPGAGLDCLAHPVKLSMSPQRSQLVAATRDSVNRLIHGAEALLDGYRAFLLLAGDSGSNRVKSLLAESLLLITRFETLKQTIASTVNTIIHPLQAVETPPPSAGRFRQWVAACQQLQSCLQALDPSQAEQVRSVHELIFALHKRFVEALGPVTLASGQGKLSRERDITWVDCTAGGEQVPLLSPSGKALMEKLWLSGTVVIMDDALIVNLKLGNHIGIIELLERAEGGKGRTVRLKFSDRFYCPDGSDKPGKLQRMWFLVQLLKAVELDKNSDNMKLSCNAVAGEMIIECPRMTSTETMQDAFKKLINVLCAINNLDIHFEHKDVFEKEQWNFTLLAQRLLSDAETEVDRFTFQNGLFSIVYSIVFDFNFNSDCYLLFGNHHQQQFIDHIRRLARSEGNLREMLMSDAIDEDTRRKLFHHLLVLYPAEATPLIEDVYGHLKDEYFVIKPSFGYSPEFYVSPGQPTADHKEKVKNAVLMHGLKYVCQRVRNDKDIVLPTIEKYPEDLQFTSDELKNDQDVVMASVTQKGYCLSYASPELRNNDVVVKTALAQCPFALQYASERFRSDKNIIQTLIADDIVNLIYASNRVLKDREYLLSLIKQQPFALMCADDSLKSDEAFLRSAIRTNPEVINTCWPLFRKFEPLEAVPE